MYSLPDIDAMKIGEMKHELQSYGISEAFFLEKTEIVEALRKARDTYASRRPEKKRAPPPPPPPAAQSQPHSPQPSWKFQERSPGTKMQYSNGYKRGEKNISEMTIKEMKRELEDDHKISTHLFLEKADLVNALEEARNAAAAAAATAASTGKKRAASASSQSSSSNNNKKVKEIVALAKKWDQKSNVSGYFLSEKLDGMRCIYDGKGGLWTRNGNPVFVPRWFSEALPRNICLDGELFLSRGMFQQCMSITRTKDANDKEWEIITFVVFDAPETLGDFPTRLKAVRLALEDCAQRNPRIVVTLPNASSDSIFSSDLDAFRATHPFPVVATLLPHSVCRNSNHAKNELERITEIGGEGLMFRKPSAVYRGGRSSDLLKLKKFIDAEAVVTAHEAGKGKHVGRLGALVCRMVNSNKTFKIGTGFKDAQRENPPPIGSTVTYRYFEETNAGLPRFPSFLRVRPSE